MFIYFIIEHVCHSNYSIVYMKINSLYFLYFYAWIKIGNLIHIKVD